MVITLDLGKMFTATAFLRNIFTMPLKSLNVYAIIIVTTQHQSLIVIVSNLLNKDNANMINEIEEDDNTHKPDIY